MDSKVYQQRVIIDQINARNQRLREFDDQIEYKRRAIDNLEEDINFLSFNKKYPYLIRKVNILDIDDATNMRLRLIKKSDEIRSQIHALNEQKERFITLNYPEMMSVNSWIKTINISSKQDIQKLIDQCTQNAAEAFSMILDCFEPEKHTTYINHFTHLRNLHLNRGKVLVRHFIKILYAKSSF